MTIESSEATERSSVRPEIQALRALAVAVVVVYHYWPGVVRGGFVGVDVFFVISGFLITGHLARSAGSPFWSGLFGFWARRARRLLPASLTVLLLTAIAVWAWVPRNLWEQFFSEIAASALYVQNWLLASNSVDYLAASNVPSPVQHYWSLSVEEQFYLVWPILVLGTALVVTRLGRAHNRSILASVLGILAIASFAYGTFLTATSPSVAYFATTVRVWEFAAGGILAVLVPTTPVQLVRTRAAVSWAGLALVIGAALGFSGATPFPGVAALVPVIGTLAVLWAGFPNAALAPSRLYALRPIQFVGDISYSLYLWHFSLLVVAAYALSTKNGLPFKLGVLAMAIVLAALSKRFIEDPVRRAPRLADRRPRRTFLVAIGAMALVVAVAGSGVAYIGYEAAASARAATIAAARPSACFGANALVSPKPNCPASTPVSKVLPQPDVAADDLEQLPNDGCLSGSDDPKVVRCVYGKPTSKIRVALIGDSHAAQWYPAIQAIAHREGWELTTFLKSACAFADGARGKPPALAAEVASCATWNAQLNKDLAAAEPFQFVITTDYEENARFVDADGNSSEAAFVAAYRAAWLPLIDRGTKLVVLRDTPHARPAGVACITKHLATPSKCDLSRHRALSPNDYLTAASAQTPGTVSIDMSDYFCGPKICPIVVGGVFVYRDENHFTATYSKSLTVPLLRELTARTALSGLISATHTHEG